MLQTYDMQMLTVLFLSESSTSLSIPLEKLGCQENLRTRIRFDRVAFQILVLGATEVVA